MPTLRYKYFAYPTNPIPRPMAYAVAVNMITGKTQAFLGVLDSGADSTTLTKDVLNGLEINAETLDDIEVGGVDGQIFVKYCDYVRVGLVDVISGKLYFPNKDSRVPAYFSPRSEFDLLGRNSFLNLCRITFDGPKDLVSIEI